jgi:hypothetical protein
MRAYPCPNLRRLVVLRAARDRDIAYTCIRCLFSPSVPRSLAERAVRRSAIPLEALACLADAGRVHLRFAPPDAESSGSNRDSAS